MKGLGGGPRKGRRSGLAEEGEAFTAFLPSFTRQGVSPPLHDGSQPLKRNMIDSKSYFRCVVLTREGFWDAVEARTYFFSSLPNSLFFSAKIDELADLTTSAVLARLG